MTRLYDNHFKSEIVTIYPGEYYISSQQEIISTVLGSCVSVCLYDLKNGIGGMNHFMLPESSLKINELVTKDSYLNINKISDEAMKYGITSMDILIYMMQKNGAERKYLKAKIFGGGNILKHTSGLPTIGDRNIKFAKSYLKTEQIEIENESVSENYGRKVFFLTECSSVFVKKIKTGNIIKEEVDYYNSLKKKKIKSDVTIY